MSQLSNILLSGSTGILGSNVLFELLRQFASGELSGKLGLIVRPGTGIHFSLGNRINQILDSSFIPDYLKGYSRSELLKPVFIIHKEVHQILSSDFPPDFTGVLFIHIAGSVNLANSDVVSNEIEYNNYLGTQIVLRNTLPILQKFVFISTAYASGHREGIIGDDFMTYSDFKFRNPYEQFKNKIEHEIVGFCEQNQIEWQILRPSIICGRLIDTPLYFIPRFSVFYLICKFFYLLKKCLPTDPMIRLYVASDPGLNIIPVDYVAKAISRLIHSSIQQVNLVHTTNVSISDLFIMGLKEFNYKNFSLTEQSINEPTIFEKRYDKTINSQLLPYLDTPAHQFDSTLVRQVLHDFKEPDVLAQFKGLIRFAAEHHFKTIY